MRNILEIKHLTKLYPGVVAIDNVSMSFARGEIHALIGENGAGKSTLIKAAAGAIQVNGGSFVIDGREYAGLDPRSAIESGIAVIYQEFNLVPSLSVAENIFLGEKIGGKYMPDFAEMHRRSAEAFASLGVSVNTRVMVGRLSTAQMQVVEIAKAITRDAKIIIMDEPSASLSVAEVNRLFKIIRTLKEQGVTVIYISHRLDEVFAISDRVSVMRDGRYIATLDIRNTTRQQLVNLMVGRELVEQHPARSADPGDVVLEVQNLCGNGVKDISFRLRRGEILGLGGLVGAGRTELARLIFGVCPWESGQVLINGAPVRIKSPLAAIKNGIGLIPEDRKREGLILDYAVDWNISIMSIRKHSKMGVVNRRSVRELCTKYFNELRIKSPSQKQLAKNLSGGNQQKVVLAKVLAAETDIIIFDEPTRGIDVGAKQEIYHLMNRLAESGISIIMISSDMEELLGMSDRIVVLHEGRLAGEVEKSEFSQDRVLELASGGI